ncbi:MAG: hypothetical protein KKB30_10265 [Proteobacteria bacterium]|nr:hypothetical protein [Pseudomonadota bacterium]MBU1717020.1 hypothetical protein [Pseudomonadota bacterium]
MNIIRIPKITIVFLSFFFLLSWVNLLSAAESKRVFIVASYEKEHVCGWPQETGVMKGLSKDGWFEGMNLEVGRYYMDTKRKNTSPELIKKEASLALAAIASFKPAVVVVLDDNAFREVALPLVEREDIQIVFSGMNGQPETYNREKHFMVSRQRPGGNVTGVYEKLYASRSMKVLAAALPDFNGKKIVGITDFSPTGNAVTRQFELEIVDRPAQIGWELKRVRNWQEYTDLIKRLNDDDEVLAIYPVALSLNVSDSLTYSAPEIFKWTIENSKKPEMALNYFFSEIGLFGGAAVDFQSMGFVAGRYAGRILNGATAGELAIVDAPYYAIVFNQGRARKLGIDIPTPLLTAADHIYQ